jgi:hypothetical protein
MLADPRSQILLNQIGSLPDVRDLPQVRFIRGPPFRRSTRRATGRGGDGDPDPFVDSPDNGTEPEPMEGVQMTGPIIDVMQEQLPPHAQEPKMEIETAKQRKARERLEKQQAILEGKRLRAIEEAQRKEFERQTAPRPMEVEAPAPVQVEAPPPTPMEVEEADLYHTPMEVEQAQLERVDPNVRRVLPPTDMELVEAPPQRPAIEGPKDVVMRDVPGPVVPKLKHQKLNITRPEGVGFGQRFMEAIIHKPGTGGSAIEHQERPMIAGGSSRARSVSRVRTADPYPKDRIGFH